MRIDPLTTFPAKNPFEKPSSHGKSSNSMDRCPDAKMTVWWKLTFCYGKSPCLRGKSTISMAISWVKTMENHHFQWVNPLKKLGTWKFHPPWWIRPPHSSHGQEGLEAGKGGATAAWADGIFRVTRSVTVWYGFVWKCCVPLNPMVLLIIIPMKNGYFIGKINPTFSDKPIFSVANTTV